MPEQVSGTWLTANAFSVLGQRPILGRDFLADDVRPGADPVVLIGYELWQHRYASRSTVLGELVRVNGQPATIVGVMGEGLKFPEDTARSGFPSVRATPTSSGIARVLRVFGRLREGVDHRQAQTEMSGIAQQLIAAYPDMTRDLVSVRVETFTDRFIGGGGTGDVSDGDGRRRLRAAHRLRERRQSPARRVRRRGPERLRSASRSAPHAGELSGSC